MSDPPDSFISAIKFFNLHQHHLIHYNLHNYLLLYSLVAHVGIRYLLLHFWPQRLQPINLSSNPHQLLSVLFPLYIDFFKAFNLICFVYLYWLSKIRLSYCEDVQRRSRTDVNFRRNLKSWTNSVPPPQLFSCRIPSTPQNYRHRHEEHHHYFTYSSFIAMQYSNRSKRQPHCLPTN